MILRQGDKKGAIRNGKLSIIAAEPQAILIMLR
jgi:hypothetical protein